MIYCFDTIELDTDQFELRQGGEVQKVEPQIFLILELFLSNPARLISREELIDRIWGGRVVSDARDHVGITRKRNPATLEILAVFYAVVH